MNSEEIQAINRSIFWEETSKEGAWQALESYYLFSKKTFPQNAKKELLNLLEKAEGTLNAARFEVKTVKAAWIQALQSAYASQLTGRYRWEKSQVLADHIALLEGILSADEEFQLLSTVAINKGQKAVLFLQSSTFETLDYLTYYHQFLQPFLQAIDEDATSIFALSTYQKSLSEEEQTIKKLGQLLFFEPLLSGNDKRTCASCHKPQKAFSDGRRTSQAFKLTQNLDRNAPTLINATFTRKFGHGLEKENLATQINFVFHSEAEMNTNYSEILQKLTAIPAYQQYFSDAFPRHPVIDSTNVLIALKVFCEQLNDLNAPFDQFIREENTLSPEAQQGFNLFMGKAQCGTCHSPPFFSGYDAFGRIDDFQRGHLGESSKDAGVGGEFAHFYKVPTLRNLDYTSPYFHNGQANDKAILWKTIFSSTSTPSLSLEEQQQITAFLEALNHNPFYEMEALTVLPSADDGTASRRSGGSY
ncbi:MAG: cytochrome c peroxidase [Bacteroidota bacterium]